MLCCRFPVPLLDISFWGGFDYSFNSLFPYLLITSLLWTDCRYFVVVNFLLKICANKLYFIKYFLYKVAKLKSNRMQHKNSLKRVGCLCKIEIISDVFSKKN